MSIKSQQEIDPSVTKCALSIEDYDCLTGSRHVLIFTRKSFTQTSGIALGIQTCYRGIWMMIAGPGAILPTEHLFLASIFGLHLDSKNAVRRFCFW
jgi:hypothetical protein